MSRRLYQKCIIGLFGLFCLGFGLALWLCPDTAVSQSERRPLAQRPALSGSALLSGGFMEDMQDYIQDQFPLREGFRRLKALTARYGFGQRVVNGLYLEQGHLSALEAELRPAMLAHAGERLTHIYESYLADTGSDIYFAIVPDKHYFLAEAGPYPSLDYEALAAELQGRTDFAAYIDLWPALSVDDYYHTDSHWRQEALLPAAERLAEAMGLRLAADYETVTLETPFYGVYAGQSALPVAADELSYLTNDRLENCRVTSYSSGVGEPIPLYDLAAAEGRDPYELFLGGAEALVVIENPAAATDRELLLFRDSFGSSLAPLLAEAYAKITLVDIRYVRSDYLASFIDFHGQDVLFLYSTTLLNDSLALS